MKMISISPKTIFIVFLAIYVVGGLSATILSFVYNFNKEYVGIAFFIGALVALLFNLKFKSIEWDNEGLGNQKLYFKISIILYSILCLILIYIFLNSLWQYYLPLTFFIIIFLISGIISSQILLKNKITNIDEKLILFEIFFLNMIVFTSFIFLFPGPYGNDAPYHVAFIKNSINSGFLIGEGQYKNYPVFHFLFIYIVEICKIENLKLIQFILLIVENIILLFGFLLTKEIFNKKIALISFLLLSFSPYMSVAKYSYFPGAFTAVLFILSMYLIFNNKSINNSLLLMISFLAIIFAHPMTPLILIMALIVLLLTSKFSLNREKITLTTILLILITTISWWMKPSDILANDLFTYSVLSIKNAIESADYTEVSRATLAPLINHWSIILSDLGFILLILFSIVGAIYILGYYANNRLKFSQYGINSVYLAIITLIFIPIPYILAIIYPQSLPGRWFPFIEVMASIFAGLSIFIIFENLQKNKMKYMYEIFNYFTFIWGDILID